MDLETNGKKIPLLKIFLISFTFDGNIAYVFNPDKVDIKPFLEVLQKNPISNHAIKYDYRCIKYIYGININVDWDTYITNALSTAGIGLMVSGANPNALDTVCKRYLKIDLDKSTRDDFMQEIWETNKHISYSADDVLAVYKLIPITKRLLEASEQQKIWEDIEKPLIKVLVDMEISGMPIDIEYALNLRDKYQEKIDELILKIEEIAPGIDHQSNKQVVDFFLQNNVKVPMKDRPNGTRTPTVEAAALEQIDHPLAKLLIEIGNYQHQLSSFLIPWTTPVDVSKKGAYNPVSKGIHGDITQVDTDTGRCCVAEGTLIEIVRDVSKNKEGIPIEEVREGDLAYTFDENMNIVLRKVLWAGKTGVKKVVRIHWANSFNKKFGYLDITPEHLVGLLDGRYRRAEDFAPEDRIPSLCRATDKHGYSELYITGCKDKIRDHRLIFQNINKYLPEVVHHINGNKLDNKPENLKGIDRSSHTTYHSSNISEEIREKLSIAGKINYKNKEHLLIRRGKEHSGYLDITREWLEEKLDKYCGNIRDLCKQEKLDRSTVKSYSKKYEIDLVQIANNFTKKKEYIDIEWFNKAKKVIEDNGINKGLVVLGVGYRRWKSIRKKFESNFNHRVVRIEYLETPVNVYDIEVEETHNFIANELKVHNSGRNPNLQQCPGDPEFRAVFIAPEGQDLITCDLSQFELRVIAELSEDEELTRLFIEREKVVSELERQLEYIDELYYTPEIGKKHPDIASLKKKLESLDMHSQTAITLFKLNPEDINFESDDWKKTRGLAKCLSFGIPLILAA